MRHHITCTICTAMLGCALAACSDRPSLVEPRATAPALLQQGGPPTPVETGPFVDELASELCGFPVVVELTGKEKLLELPGGRTILIAPGLTGTVTNATTGTTVTLNVTGPAQFNPLPDGGTEVVFTGRNVFIDPDAGFLLLIGRFDFVFDANGIIVQGLEGSGQSTDICALLA
jgi:hypothetical protein